jgi:hypothetical protein
LGAVDTAVIDEQKPELESTVEKLQIGLCG